MKNTQKRYFVQDFKTYDIFRLPKNFVVKGDLDISNMDLFDDEMPDLSDVTVMGNFDCSWKRRKTLKGTPKIINGDFICSDNLITSFEYGPVKAKRYICMRNNLETLKGISDNAEELICWDNFLQDFKYCSETLRKCICFNNCATTFKGLPKTMDEIDIRFNRLSDFIGAPKTINKLNCSDNYNLSDLTGLPEHCKDFICERTPVYYMYQSRLKSK